MFISSKYKTQNLCTHLSVIFRRNADLYNNFKSLYRDFNENNENKSDGLKRSATAPTNLLSRLSLSVRARSESAVCIMLNHLRGPNLHTRLHLQNYSISYFVNNTIHRKLHTYVPYQGGLHGFQFGWMELPNFQNLATITT